MKNLTLSICRIDRKCISSDGEWDRTWDDSYEYFIYDEEGFEVAGMDGYRTREEAREAGEKKLKELEEEQ